MTRRAGPPWLAELQARFGDALRTPLDRSTGSLRADVSRYAPEILRELVDAPSMHGHRLAVYQRQTWFRFFSACQTELPLTVRLVGFFRFNEVAERFLLAHPPTGHDLARVADGLADHVIATEGDRHPAWAEAARIDEAWRSVLAAPAEAPFRPTADDAATLVSRRLVPSATMRIVHERWPLCELRRKLLAENDPDERPVPLPPPHPGARAWALFRRPGATGQLPLAPAQARLLELLAARPVGEALAALEAELAGAPELPGRVQGWLAQAVELGFFRGLTP